MKIKKMYVKNFGTLCNYTARFNDGVNIISLGNESGKTTSAQFIKAMLYGINSSVRNIRSNPRKKYMPWGETSMGGELTVEHNGVTYLIIRTFGIQKAYDTVNVINDVTGERIEKYCTDAPLYEMTGVGEEAFEKALFLNHLSVDMDGKNGEIMDKLAGLSQSGDEDFSYKQGCEILDNAIKEIESPRNGRLKLEKDRLSEFYAALKKHNADEENKLLQKEKALKLKEEEDRLKNTDESFEKSFFVIMALIALLSLALYFVTPYLTVFGFVSLLAYIGKKFFDKKKRYQKNIERLLEISKEIGKLEAEIIKNDTFDIATVEKNIQSCKERIYRYEKKLLKLKLSRECLDDAFLKLQQGFGVKLNSYVSEILSVVTENKYDGVKVDKNYEMTVHCKDGWQSFEYLSDGAYSQIYFALKMSIVKMLYQDMPLILDDAFALYDEKRKKRAMEYLSNCDSQVILFVVK